MEPGPPPRGPRSPPLCARTASDFDRVELEIARRLSGTADRCSFLRSSSYLGFRMRALYRARDQPASIYTPCGMFIEYVPDPHEGGRVVVYSPPEPPPSADSDAPPEGIPNRCVQSSGTYSVYVPVRRPGRPRNIAAM